jgi:hypothetical protein
MGLNRRKAEQKTKKREQSPGDARRRPERLAAPSTTARKDVDQREERDDDHRSDGNDGNGGSGEDHVAFLSGSWLMKTLSLAEASSLGFQSSLLPG